MVGEPRGEIPTGCLLKIHPLISGLLGARRIDGRLRFF